MIILIPLTVWLLGQGFKFVYQSLRHKKFQLQHFMDLGGMPSTHSAMVASLATIVGLTEGWNSSLFGSTVIYALIIVHDALRLRNVVGEHSRILNRLVTEFPFKNGDTFPQVKERTGHTLSEVAIGLGMGILVTLALFQFFVA